MIRIPFMRTACAVLVTAALAAASPVEAKLRIAASTNDLASIAATVGGEQVEVFSIARPNADPHRVEALPSYMVKVSRAQLFLEVGLGLDQWANAILEGSRNASVQTVDCSKGVRVLEKPGGKVDASMGDVHPDGNPHYWLDPRNGAIVATNIAEALARLDAAHAADYRSRAEAFGREADAAWQRGRSLAATLPSRTVFTYHRSWSYLADAFGLEVAATVEPVPGIPPTVRQLAELVRVAKARKIGLLIQEPYYSAEAGRFLAREAGVRTVIASSACDAPTAGSYLAHFAAVLESIAGGRK
ncbi:MAG: zinc ABC transporter substrate-binding protein [Candidatus Eisenbacteria bacterium]|uniref:Zinc ABC transporter substrate-binding protein n=1 Tax=Eiseniibacteriota bacterium TaxID=2212470 RepID=A0A849SYK7_UNCEI|nr:zinc ABC transporter substrate-binding protein [Candidatus Eisenbacteria bacterium]